MASKEPFRITVLGARGSVPTCGRDTLVFGGATSCYMVEAGGEVLFLDAGSGITDAPPVEKERITVLLTHPHLDHIQGLPFFPALNRKEKQIDLYIRARGEIAAWDYLDRVFSPPIWPCTLRQYPAQVACHALQLPLRIGAVEIDGMEGEHPGGSTVYRLRCGEKSLVYATDFEHSGSRYQELVKFARDADIVLYDGQYTEEEYNARKGFGHSTAQWGLRLMRESGAKRLLLVHHDPRHSDEMLEEEERRIGLPNVSYARRLEVIEL